MCGACFFMNVKNGLILSKEGILMFLPHRAKVNILRFREENCAVKAAQPIIFTACYNGHYKIKKN
jgi:hypothetical protein